MTKLGKRIANLFGEIGFLLNISPTKNNYEEVEFNSILSEKTDREVLKSDWDSVLGTLSELTEGTQNPLGKRK